MEHLGSWIAELPFSEVTEPGPIRSPVQRDDAEVEYGGRGCEDVQRLPHVAPVLAEHPHLQQGIRKSPR